MTKPETTKARRILADRISSSEVVRDGKIYGLSVAWADGSGQKVFWALDAVEYHATERRGGPRKLA